jgi:hypothetical protein
MDTTRLRDVFQSIGSDQAPGANALADRQLAGIPPSGFTPRLLERVSSLQVSHAVDVPRADRVLWQLICL